MAIEHSKIMVREPRPTWALFVGGKDDNPVYQATEQLHGRMNRYRVEGLVGVAGSPPVTLAPGWTVVRIENDDEFPIQLARKSVSVHGTPVVAFAGVTQHLHYTSAAQREKLELFSHAEFEPSEETIAVLIPLRKSAKWWQLAQEQRQAYFQTTEKYEGHTAIGLRYASRVHRKLYHSRYMVLSSPFDFLTYFEFHNSHRSEFMLLLRELRDISQNPEWGFVELEFEIWMKKTA